MNAVPLRRGTIALLALLLPWAGPAHAAESCARPKTHDYSVARMNNPWEVLETYRLGAGLGPLPEWRWDDDGWDQWRAEVERAGLSAGKDPGYLSCDTRYATARLKQRIEKLGPGHPYIALFVEHQTQVFRNCTDDPTWVRPDPARLTALPADVAELAAADLAYQQASALFVRRYGSCRNDGEALARFLGIAADPDAPDRNMARYMAAALRMRTGDVAGALAEAEAMRPLAASDPHLDLLLDSLVGTAAYNSRDPDLLARQLTSMADLLTVPAGTLDADPVLRQGFVNALWELSEWFLTPSPVLEHPPPTVILPPGWWRTTDPLPPDWVYSAAVRQVSLGSDMLDHLQTRLSEPQFAISWYTGDSDRLRTPAYAALVRGTVERWERSGNPAWAAAAAELMLPGDPAEPALRTLLDGMRSRLDTCTHTAADAQIYPGLLFHLARLRLTAGDVAGFDALIAWDEARGGRRYLSDTVEEALSWLVATDRIAEARTLLDRFLRVPGLDISTGHRQLLATTMDEAVAALADSPSLTILDPLPVAVLADLARRAELPTTERLALARVAWMRAWVLERPQVQAAVEPVLRELEPALIPDLDAVAAAKAPADRTPATLLLLLRHPRMTLSLEDQGQDDEIRSDPGTILDNGFFGSNWGCRLDETVMLLDAMFDLFRSDHGKYFYFRKADAPVPADPALGFAGEVEVHRIGERLMAEHPLTGLIDREELAALSRLPNGTRLLAERTVAAADEMGLIDRLTGADRDIPELLHLAVRATRYGCRKEGGHGVLSRRAYTLLHRRYGGTPWARRTPYWFDCTTDSGRCAW